MDGSDLCPSFPWGIDQVPFVPSEPMDRLCNWRPSLQGSARLHDPISWTLVGHWKTPWKRCCKTPSGTPEWAIRSGKMLRSSIWKLQLSTEKHWKWLGSLQVLEQGQLQRYDSWFNQFFSFFRLFLFRVCVEFWYRPIGDSFHPSDFCFLSDSLHLSFISTSGTASGWTSGHFDFSGHPINFQIVLS